MILILCGVLLYSFIKPRKELLFETHLFWLTLYHVTFEGKEVYPQQRNNVSNFFSVEVEIGDPRLETFELQVHLVS